MDTTGKYVVIRSLETHRHRTPPATSGHTGVGLTDGLTHMLHAQSLQSCPTLCDPKDCSLPGSSVHGILQATILEWVAMSSSGSHTDTGKDTQRGTHTHTHSGILRQPHMSTHTHTHTHRESHGHTHAHTHMHTFRPIGSLGSLGTPSRGCCGQTEQTAPRMTCPT